VLPGKLSRIGLENWGRWREVFGISIASPLLVAIRAELFHPDSKLPQHRVLLVGKTSAGSHVGALALLSCVAVHLLEGALRWGIEEALGNCQTLLLLYFSFVALPCLHSSFHASSFSSRFPGTELPFPKCLNHLVVGFKSSR